ncbi:mycofactocin-coupled SDR family oxidoreductase [Mycobacterium avium subsp. hominissuis]|uniref:mycofactocin-coupled SDR family oxidoreductase n=1 Tax=Mycobacterium avium TaxID=1764 RepID=UPI001CC62E2C|nr:mycofactocin-coupled SDR family oxidoreductase [Mycobacterium avium]MBZ4561146.1 mycofactocin-coupled SDR family oxidoreductase [Mycobacterium avium subsp. hominissuis]MBZ4569718.1 mycofactocin-coupled SDR family oxidoreductase [Mycobacterium avium subsp. hominissuis]MBZ4587786.1 mycofactocin-coupled SDR family oxidoreductase [Mycobacterium avium subsp. hominissuis]MBZ4625959.1 mycofactocin-coupled SDR family oxidoreductase [Mycobacterium avium subsp. hominissuis]
MSQSLTGKVALITGAARGQGRAHAARLAAEGADIIAVDLAGPLPPSVPYDSSTPEDLAETADLVRAAGRRVVTAQTDVRDLDALTSSVDAAVGELGRLDVIVANAGICSPAPWNRITAQAFRDTIDTNVVGTWNTVMAGAQHIIDGCRGGSIILIGSAAGINMQSFMIHYTASKHAVVGMARAFAAELGRYNIRVNSLNPGAVATPMGTGRMRDALRAAADDYPHLRGLHKPLLPEGIAQPEDIADAVAWLASDQSRLVTASQVSVDLGVGYV